MRSERGPRSECTRTYVSSALMLNNIKLRECIAVNLLENSFSRLWWAFFPFVLRSFSKFVFVVHALFFRRRRRSPACQLERRLLGQPFICYSRDCAVPIRFRFCLDIPFGCYFCARTSTMTTTSICLARIRTAFGIQCRQIVSKWVASRFQKHKIYSFAIAANMPNCALTTNTEQIVKKTNNDFNRCRLSTTRQLKCGTKKNENGEYDCRME